MFEYILKIQLSDILRSDVDRDRTEVSHLHKSIDIDKNDIETIREQEFNDVIHWYRTPRRR